VAVVQYALCTSFGKMFKKVTFVTAYCFAAAKMLIIWDVH